MKQSLFVIAAAVAGLASACSQQQSDDVQNQQDAVADVDVLPPDESVATPSNDLATGVIDTPVESAAVPNPATTIPAALHGRWGLTRGDCTSTRGDAKGQVLISADTIRFYESVAKPAKVRGRTDTSIQGDFAFVGEGQTWTSPMQWSVSGRQLTRVDSQADSKLVYARC